MSNCKGRLAHKGFMTEPPYRQQSVWLGTLSPPSLQVSSPFSSSIINVGFFITMHMWFQVPCGSMRFHAVPCGSPLKPPGLTLAHKDCKCHMFFMVEHMFNNPSTRGKPGGSTWAMIWQRSEEVGRLNIWWQRHMWRQGSGQTMKSITTCGWKTVSTGNITWRTSHH